MAKKKRRQSLRPPAGFYDPGLDAQERAARRGLTDLEADINPDTGTTSTRNLSDFILGQGDLERQRTELGEDVTRQRSGVETDFGRSLTDLLTERQQGGEDYTRNLAQLQRNYDQLGTAQAQQQRAAGVSAGGARAQAAAKRTANQAWEKAPIDTGFKRFEAASKLSEGRLGEDKTTALSDILRAEKRGGEGIDRAGAQLGLGYKRGTEDLSTQLTRAQRENTQYGLDVNEARVGQATQMGWKPPAAPKTAAQKAAEQQRKARAAAAAANKRARQAAR